MPPAPVLPLFIERDCSTSMRRKFISMSSSFSSRRMTGNGSGAFPRLGSEKRAHDDNLCGSIIW